MIKAVLTFLLTLSIFIGSYAQDPGSRDSLIIGTVIVPPGAPSVMVPIYAVTDDSIASITLPLEWASIDNRISPAGIYYFNPLIFWDYIADTIDYSNERLLIRGINDMGGDSNPVLNTASQRVVIIRIRIAIHTGAGDQFVTLSPYIDVTHGGPRFGLANGTTSFAPIVIPGGVDFTPTSIEDREPVPSDFQLRQNYPNPFNNATEIRFGLARQARIELVVYDLLGRKVNTIADGEFAAGEYLVSWDGRDSDGNQVTSGIYFYILRDGVGSVSKKMVLLK
mgnify:CR=1 FL=1